MSLKRQSSINLSLHPPPKKRKESAFPTEGITCAKALSIISGSLNISASEILLPSQDLSAYATHDLARALPEGLPRSLASPSFLQASVSSSVNVGGDYPHSLLVGEGGGGILSIY